MNTHKDLDALLRNAAGGNLLDSCILLGYRGSIAHGMYIPGSDPDSVDDKDAMGIVVPPKDHYFGLASLGPRSTLEIKEGEWDVVVYEARKMVSLLAVGNPNVLSLLWLDEYLKETAAGRLLIENRRLFATKRVYHSFIEYAHGQLKRMTHLAFEGYMGEKRKGLVQRHGYDTKNAAHCIRILRMGTEFLQDGTLNVNRAGLDADELLDIKRGGWTLEKVQEEAGLLFAADLAEANSSPLPEQPDMGAINELCVAVVETALARKESER